MVHLLLHCAQGFVLQDVGGNVISVLLQEAIGMLRRFGRHLQNRLLFPVDRTIVGKAVLNDIALSVLSLGLLLRIDMLILEEGSEGIRLPPGCSCLILLVVVELEPLVVRVSDDCSLVDLVLFQFQIYFWSMNPLCCGNLRLCFARLEVVLKLLFKLVVKLCCNNT